MIRRWESGMEFGVRDASGEVTPCEDEAAALAMLAALANPEYEVVAREVLRKPWEAW